MVVEITPVVLAEPMTTIFENYVVRNNRETFKYNRSIL